MGGRWRRWVWEGLLAALAAAAKRLGEEAAGRRSGFGGSLCTGFLVKLLTDESGEVGGDVMEDAELRREKVEEAGVRPSELVLKSDSGGDAGERDGVDLLPASPWTEGDLQGRRFWVGGGVEPSKYQGRLPRPVRLGDVAIEEPFCCGTSKGSFERGIPSLWRNCAVRLLAGVGNVSLGFD